MKVSIITPFYKGNQYMEAYVAMVRANQKNMLPEDELEAVIINDSPEVAVELPESLADCNINVYDQKENGGIHKARVRGLEVCSGDYVIFLDQDDILAEDAVAKHVAAMKNWQAKVKRVHKNGDGRMDHTVVGKKVLYPLQVSNAVLEQENAREIWYRTNYHKKQIGNLETYLRVGTQIISPGQCMIYKESIPDEWKKHCLTKNGSDDYYLWLLMLGQRIHVEFLDEPLYVHRYTAKNLSADTSVTDESAYEFIGYLRESDILTEKQLDTLDTMLHYKADFRRGGKVKKALLSIRHFSLFMSNVRFKKKTKTPYGFNR